MNREEKIERFSEKETEELYDLLFNDLKDLFIEDEEGITLSAMALCAALKAAGYRKANEVRKEAAKEIADFLRKRADTINSLFKMNTMMLNELADEIEKKFCVEVDE